MLMTSTGKERLDIMMNSDTKISINISSEDITGQNSTSFLVGNTSPWPVTDDNGKVIAVPFAAITIYTTEIQKTLNVSGNSNASEKAKAYSGLTMEEAIGVVAGHESVHTETENIQQKRDNRENGTTYDVEEKPTEIEYIIIDELKNKR